MRILIAEDDQASARYMEGLMSRFGECVVTSDGEQAVDLAREHRPDLVILDVKMPVKDGISAAEVIGKERIAPCVMLTAFSDRDLVERARDAGVMAVVAAKRTRGIPWKAESMS